MDVEGFFQPGRNCWRLVHSHRVTLLVDGEDYFRAIRAALRQARRSIHIIAWDIDSRVQLPPEPGDDLPSTLGAFLTTVVAKQPGLHAYILAWDFAMIYAMEREWLPIYKFGWRKHPRLHFRLDDRHPAGASQHQKLVVVDDRVAFVGGFDLTKRRWDSQAHLANDPRRLDPEGIRYPPFHDVAIMVDGAAASALGTLARERWLRAGAKKAAPVMLPDNDPWPPGVQNDLCNTQVAIARTQPRFLDYPEAREIERLFLDAIASAKHLLYIENQYFTAKTIADALSVRLAQPHGPEVVLVLPFRSSGWLEQNTMDVLRGRFLEQLREADQFHRLTVYYPDRRGLGDHYIYQHAKVFIADDCLLHVGSANLSNRSMGLDSECDLAIAARNDDEREAIAKQRNRLIAEHIGIAEADVAAILAQTGNLATTISSLPQNERQLRPLPIVPLSAHERWLAETAFYDPEKPLDPVRFAQQFLPPEQWRYASHRLLVLAGILAVLLGIASWWRYGLSSEWLNMETINRVAAGWRYDVGAIVTALGVYVIAGLLIVPITLLIVATVWAFGPLVGAVCAITGATLSAILMYSIGRQISRNRLSRLISQRLNRLSVRLTRRGVIAVIGVRLVPVAPFSIVNLMAGASHIPLVRFVIGTVIGMVPGVLAIALFMNRLAALLSDPKPANVVLLSAVVIAVAIAAIVIKRSLLPRD